MKAGLSTLAGDRGEIVIFQEAQGQPGLEVRLEQESVWLSLNQIAALFERDKSVISRHLGNVFGKGNTTARQLLHFLQQLPPTERPTRSSTSTSTRSSPSAIV